MGKNPSLTINCIKRLDLNTYEIMYEARREVEILVELIEDDYRKIEPYVKKIYSYLAKKQLSAAEQ